MTRMHAIEAAVEILEEEGISVVFGVSGAAINPLHAAMKKPGGIDHILARYVKGASHVAEGYTRSQNSNIDVCTGTPGPAGTDMITGLYSTSADSIPIPCITGQAPTGKFHKEGFQAIDIEAIATPVTKVACTILEADQLPGVFQKASQEMHSDRSSPVLLDLPFGVQAAEVEFDIDLYQPLTPRQPQATRVQVVRALEMLNDAEKPVIIVGGGIISAGASELLREFVELTGVPVIQTLCGWGVLSDDHPPTIGRIGCQAGRRYGNASYPTSDFVPGVGSRWANRHTGVIKTYTEGHKFIHVDIEPAQIDRIFTLGLGTVFGAESASTLPIQVARDMKSRGELKDRSRWVAECAERKRTTLRRSDFDYNPIKPQRVYHEMNKVFEPGTHCISTIGLAQIATSQFLHAYRPRHWINVCQVRLLGWTIPAALGTIKADPSAPVVAISGDHDFQFLIEELVVSVQFNLPYIHILPNSAYLGLTCQSQRAFDIDYCVQLSFENVNIPETNGYGVGRKAVAEGLGCKAICVFASQDVVPALQGAQRLCDEFHILVVVEIITECVTNIAMGPDIDKVTELEETLDL